MFSECSGKRTPEVTWRCSARREAGIMDSHPGWPRLLLVSLAVSHSQITHGPVGKANSENTLRGRSDSSPSQSQNSGEMERKIGGNCQGFKQSFVMYQQEMAASKAEGNQKIALSLTSSIPDRL